MSSAYHRRTPPLFQEVLREYGEASREALLRALPDREPRRYLYDVIGEYPRRGGRYMRPAIHIASAKAHGASFEQAISTAVSIELLHNALIVIDDIQDESEQRRGLPTLHRRHGLPIALNAGATMSILSLVPLLQNVRTNSPMVALWVFEGAVEVAQLAAEGQAMELGWRFDNRVDVTEAEYLDMVLRKTCSYSTMFPMKAGAIVGRCTRDIPDEVTRYGFLIGAAFQIQDDLLNLAGDAGQYGKELRGDLLEGKRTLLTIRLLQRCTATERARFRAIMAKRRDEKTESDLSWIADLLDGYGCTSYVRQMVQGLVGAAQHEFERGFERLPPSRDKEFLRHLATWIVEQS